jgi:hypothetical protein
MVAVTVVAAAVMAAADTAAVVAAMAAAVAAVSILVCSQQDSCCYSQTGEACSVLSATSRQGSPELDTCMCVSEQQLTFACCCLLLLSQTVVAAMAEALPLPGTKQLVAAL